MRYLEFQKYMDYYQNTIYTALRKILKSKVSWKSKFLHMLKKNKPKFKFNFFNFKIGSILMNSFNEYELAKSYFNQYLNKLSSADRISKSVIYYNLANCSYFTKDNKSEYYLNKSIKYLRKSDKDYYDLKSKIDLLSKTLKIENTLYCNWGSSHAQFSNCTKH